MPDYMFLLESRLSPAQHALLGRVQELAQSQGVNVYLTGGAVRDLISGAPIRDLDFTVEGNPAALVRDLHKEGAQILADDSKLRETELQFRGEVDASLAQARDEVYSLPGSRPESRWATIMEDLRRRDFSVNAIAISLNPASRGLLLDPTNGLADIERREVRALSIHCFTNQPSRLLRILRYVVRLDFKMESRTEEWFELALERGLDKQIAQADAGREVRQLGAEERPAAVLKSWDSRGLLPALHPHLGKRKLDYDGLGRLARAAEQISTAGLRVSLFAPVAWYLLHGFSSRERISALKRMALRPTEVAAVAKLETAARDAAKALKGRQTEAARDAYDYLERMPRDLLAFVLAEFSNSRISSKVRNYLHKWRPLRSSLPAGELEALGVARGPQFDRILDQLFNLQLKGKGKTPIDRTKLLRNLAGIKPEAKKTEKKMAKEPPASKAGASTAVPRASSKGAGRELAKHATSRLKPVASKETSSKAGGSAKPSRNTKRHARATGR